MSEDPQEEGILADVISRSTVLTQAEQEETNANHFERRAEALLQQAQQAAGMAQRARIRAEVLREVATEQKTAPAD